MFKLCGKIAVVFLAAECIKRAWKLLLSLILLLAVLVLIVAMPASAADLSGDCGEGVYWQYDEGTATLTISGSGHIKDYDVFDLVTFTSTEPAPWSEYILLGRARLRSFP